MTRSVVFSLPSSCRMFSDAAVNALVLEAMANMVCSSTLAGLPSSRTP